jgi:hypothetical protein
MLPHYIRYPFVSQYTDNMYTQQQPSYDWQAYSQEYMQEEQYYSQPSYGSYDDNYYSDYSPRPDSVPPQLSNNPVSTSIVLFKELTAYPNYGNPSRNADILYPGTRGTWTFESPAFLVIPGGFRAKIIIRAVLDDHYSVAVNRYSARITVNGDVVHNGPVPLQHGSPSGTMFTNWRELTFNIRDQKRVNRVTIENTSATGPNDWIGFDWMELRVSPR